MNEENDTVRHSIHNLESFSNKLKFFKKIEPNKHHSINNENRKKRAATPFPDGKSVCGLYMRVDQYYYNQIYSNEGNKVSYLNFI
jgi:hypothetical protein